MEKLVKAIRQQPPIRLFIATPCFGGMCHTQFVQSLIALTSVLRDIGVYCEYSLLSGESLISRARNSLVAQFMSKDFTHLLFLDSDLVFEPIAVLRLLASRLEFCGAIYPKKAINWERVKSGELCSPEPPRDTLSPCGASPTPCASCPDNISDLNVNRLDDAEVQAEFLPVKHLATGFMCFRRSVIEALVLKHPDRKYRNNVAGYADCGDWFYDLFAVGVVDGEYLSEDYYFCHLARECGIELWADIKTRLGHIGQMTYWGCLENQLKSDGLDQDFKTRQ